jgi:hypothetical protein
MFYGSSLLSLPCNLFPKIVREELKDFLPESFFENTMHWLHMWRLWPCGTLRYKRKD